MRLEQRRSVIYSQNFLHNGRLVERLIRRSRLGPLDLVYEIGPGRGIITERLARACKQVVAIEKDRELACRLRRRFAETPNVRVVAGDFLTHPLPYTPYKVFASVPFNITTAVVTKLAAAPRPPDDACLVVQREAAERFTGVPAGSLMAVLLKPWFELSVVHQFDRGDFSPRPGVDVVMMRMSKRGPPLVAAGDAHLFRDLITFAFTAAEPTIGHLLRTLLGKPSGARIASAHGLDPTLRRSQVSFEQWMAVFSCFKVYGLPRAYVQISGAEQRLRRQQAGLEKSHRTRITTRRAAPARQVARR